jgi:phosphoglycerol geranylgeranyltransferase
VKKIGIEAIPMGYIVIEPGAKVGEVGEADLIPRDKPEIAKGYALAAQFFGMKLVYLESGSGAPKPVPFSMISSVKNSIDIPLVVGGGIKTKEDARNVVRAGADVIVTGTVVEEAGDAKAKISEIVSSIK